MRHARRDGPRRLPTPQPERPALPVLSALLPVLLPMLPALLSSRAAQAAALRNAALRNAALRTAGSASAISPRSLVVGALSAAGATLALALRRSRARGRALREEAQRLSRSEERYRVLAEASEEVFLEFRPDENLLLVGDGFEALYGRPPARAPEDLPALLHPEDRERCAARWRAFSEECGAARLVIDVRLRRGCDEPPQYAWCRLRLSALLDADGRRRAVVGKLTDISQERLNAERLELKARTDSLTGLLNRAGLEEAIRARLGDTSPRPCAVLVLDIDLFKEINDRYGHDVGDEALRVLSAFLRAHFRETDVVGRLGGDEFMMLMDGVDNPARLKQALVRLRAGLCDVRVPGVDRALSASVGAALFPGAGESFEALYHNADVALYEAKHSGRGTFALYGDTARRQDAAAAIATPATPAPRAARAPRRLVPSGRMAAPSSSPAAGDSH